MQMHSLEDVAISKDLDYKTLLAAAQRSDPIFYKVIQQVSRREKLLLAGNWRKYPLKRYHQI